MLAPRFLLFALCRLVCLITRVSVGLTSLSLFSPFLLAGSNNEYGRSKQLHHPLHEGNCTKNSLALVPDMQQMVNYEVHRALEIASQEPHPTPAATAARALNLVQAAAEQLRPEDRPPVELITETIARAFGVTDNQLLSVALSLLMSLMTICQGDERRNIF